MNERESARRRGFWPLALLWLPVEVVTTTAFRFMLEMTPSEMFGMWLPMVLAAASSLVVLAPCGLPLALACGNGGAKLVHGSGGIVSLRAEQNSAT